MPRIWKQGRQIQAAPTGPPKLTHLIPEAESFVLHEVEILPDKVTVKKHPKTGRPIQKTAARFVVVCAREPWGLTECKDTSAVVTDAARIDPADLPLVWHWVRQPSKNPRFKQFVLREEDTSPALLEYDLQLADTEDPAEWTLPAATESPEPPAEASADDRSRLQSETQKTLAAISGRAS